MAILFYIRFIGFTAGTLVYPFLIALILGRRPRLFERLLFFLILSLFLIYSGGLLEINASMQYASPPDATRLLYHGLAALGVFLLLPLAWHTHYAYCRQVRNSPCSVFARPALVAFYLVLLIEFVTLPLAAAEN